MVGQFLKLIPGPHKQSKMATASGPKPILAIWHLKGTKKTIDASVKFQHVEKSFGELLAGFQVSFNRRFNRSDITLTHFEEADGTMIDKALTVSVIGPRQNLSLSF